jgi:cytochrome c-type biogenesis protein CcmH/NrfG
VNLINKRRTADGIALLDRVIVRFPDAPDPYFYRGFARAQASQNAEAKADLEKYLTLAPADSPQVAKAKELLTSLK